MVATAADNHTNDLHSNDLHSNDLHSNDIGDLVESGYRPPKLIPRMREVWVHRELLRNLTRRELKVRHKNSVIGIFWNLLNPLLQLVVYSFVFTVVLANSTPRFPIKLLAGMVIFQLFAQGVTGATGSVVSSAALVKKIWFPREILPMSAVASNFVTFLSRLLILVAGLAAFRQEPEWSMIWLLPIAVAIIMIFATGLGMLLAAINVLFRDVSHFLELIMLALFWGTPIVYQYDFVAKALVERFGTNGEYLAMLNPLIPIVMTFQRVLYTPTNFDADVQASFAYTLRPTSWYLQQLAISGTVAVAFLYVGLRVFARLEGRFAERL